MVHIWKIWVLEDPNWWLYDVLGYFYLSKWVFWGVLCPGMVFKLICYALWALIKNPKNWIFQKTTILGKNPEIFSRVI